MTAEISRLNCNRMVMTRSCWHMIALETRPSYCNICNIGNGDVTGTQGQVPQEIHTAFRSDSSFWIWQNISNWWGMAF